MTAIETGAVLQVTASVQSDAKSATLDVHSVVADAMPEGRVDLTNIGAVATTQPAAGRGPTPSDTSVSYSIDRVVISSQELHTTMRVPIGPAVVIGGMTAEPNAKEGSAAQWVLILTVGTN
jgi:hypothetical protein